MNNNVNKILKPKSSSEINKELKKYDNDYFIYLIEYKEMKIKSFKNLGFKKSFLYFLIIYPEMFKKYYFYAIFIILMAIAGSIDILYCFYVSMLFIICISLLLLSAFLIKPYNYDRMRKYETIRLQQLLNGL